MNIFSTHLRVLVIGTILACLCLHPKKAFAEDPPTDGQSAKVGFDIRRMHDQQGNTFWSGNIPTLTGGYPILRRYIQVELGWRIEWGFTKFYVDHFPDFLPSLGLRFYPWGKTLSFYGNGGWGTFLFNNNTLTAEAGGNIDIPLGKSEWRDRPFLALGMGYFSRKVYRVAEFVEKPHWYINSPGVVFSMGLLIRTLDL